MKQKIIFFTTEGVSQTGPRGGITGVIMRGAMTGSSGVERNLAMMSTNTFRDFYGRNDGFGGTDYARAAQLANSLAASGTSGSEQYRNEGFFTYASIDGGQTWTNNGWTADWVLAGPGARRSVMQDLL